MTQKMDKVTLPIKIRAILAGFRTGYNDRYYMHDNSWWTSFGTSGALLWVRRWLLLLCSVMGATAVAAVIHAIVLAVQSVSRLMESALPLSFAFLISLHFLWLCYEPAKFVMEGASMEVAPRFAEVAVTRRSRIMSSGDRDARKPFAATGIGRDSTSPSHSLRSTSSSSSSTFFAQ